MNTAAVTALVYSFIHTAFISLHLVFFPFGLLSCLYSSNYYQIWLELRIDYSSIVRLNMTTMHSPLTLTSPKAVIVELNEIMQFQRKVYNLGTKMPGLFRSNFLG